MKISHMLHHMILTLKRMLTHPNAILARTGKQIFGRGFEMVLHVPFQIEFARGAEFAAGFEADEGFVAFWGGGLGGGSLGWVCVSRGGAGLWGSGGDLLSGFGF